MTAIEDGYRTSEVPVHDPALEPDLARLFGELREEASILIGHEVELAKAELQEAKQDLTKGAIGFGAAGVLALFAVVLLSIAAALGLAEVMPMWAAFLVVGAVWAALAAIAAVVGKSAFSRFDPVPRRTIQTLKEDARWARTQIS